jgi:hypothetical protein
MAAAFTYGRSVLVKEYQTSGSHCPLSSRGFEHRTLLASKLSLNHCVDLKSRIIHLLSGFTMTLVILMKNHVAQAENIPKMEWPPLAAKFVESLVN